MSWQLWEWDGDYILFKAVTGHGSCFCGALCRMYAAMNQCSPLVVPTEYAIACQPSLAINL